MKKIDRVMMWYDSLSDDCRFFAFFCFVLVPICIIQMANPFVALFLAILAALVRTMYLIKNRTK